MKATYLPKNDLVVTRTIKIINDWLYRLGNVQLALSNLADVVLKSLQCSDSNVPNYCKYLTPYLDKDCDTSPILQNTSDILKQRQDHSTFRLEKDIMIYLTCLESNLACKQLGMKPPFYCR